MTSKTILVQFTGGPFDGRSDHAPRAELVPGVAPRGAFRGSGCHAIYEAYRAFEPGDAVIEVFFVCNVSDADLRDDRDGDGYDGWLQESDRFLGGQDT